MAYIINQEIVEFNWSNTDTIDFKRCWIELIWCWDNRLCGYWIYWFDVDRINFENVEVNWSSNNTINLEEVKFDTLKYIFLYRKIGILLDLIGKH